MLCEQEELLLTGAPETSTAEITPPVPTGVRTGKAVVVHGGARDSYQLACALFEAGLLEALVTDIFWPADRKWAGLVESRLPSMRRLLVKRSQKDLPLEHVKMCWMSGLRCLLLDKLPGVPFVWRRRSTRAADAALGRAAARHAKAYGAGLVAYSYFGFHAISNYGSAALLFQVHPHPATVRRILMQELDAHPDCADSLRQEWELALPQKDFDHLVEETHLASSFLVASSFTRDSLIEHGTPPEKISVVPYGVDLERFRPAPKRERNVRSEKLKLLFVGRINQRKGIRYLLEALRLLKTDKVELTVCGRVVDGLELFKASGAQVQVRPSVSAEELVLAYQAADLFVFPSVAEGFGQVLLESLACGLPVLSTTRTAAPDLIQHGREGFIVEPGNVESLATHINWAMTHREELERMRVFARLRAEQFTWARFRARSAEVVRRYLERLSLEEAR